MPILFQRFRVFRMALSGVNSKTLTVLLLSSDPDPAVADHILDTYIPDYVSSCWVNYILHVSGISPSTSRSG